MNKETNTLRKRVKRYARVTKAVAGVGARVAGDRLGLKGDRQKRAEHARLVLGGLKGPVMKIAQLLAALPDILPPEYAAELSHLQADAPPMGPAFVRRRMAAELGPDWQKKFKKFDIEAAHAASLGQVHRAVARDGTLLACKLQYPDMSSVVEADLKQLKLALALFSGIDRKIDTAQVQAELADRMREELAYGLEAKHIALYRQILAGAGGIHIPAVHAALSTDRLLTMTWLEGERLADICDTRNLQDRNAVAANLFQAWYLPFYRFGIIHGDPHLGNYTVRPDNGINLLDFGCVRIFHPGLIQGVLWLYEALRKGDEALAVRAYKAWGFRNPDKALIDVLNLWARFVYAPFLEDKKRSLEETNTGAYGREIALKVRRELRKTAGVTIPRAFVLIDRASVGLGAVFLRLGASLNWHRLFLSLVDDFDSDELAARQDAVLRAARLRG